MSQKQSPLRIVRFLFSLWRVSPVLVSLLLVTQILFAILTTTIAPYFVSQLLTHIADGTANLSDSLSLLLGYSLVLFLGDVVSIRLSIAFAYLSQTKMQSKVAISTLDHLLKQSLTYHSNNMSGSMVSNNTKLNGSIERFWDTLMFTVVPIITTIVSVCIVLTFIFWPFAVALAILSAIVITIMVKAQSSMTPLSRAVADSSSASTGYFADVVSNISAVKSFAGEKYELSEYKKRIVTWRKANMKELKGVLVITGSFGILMLIMNIVAYSAAIVATQYQLATIGVIYLIISYTLNVVSQLWAVGGATRTYIRIIGDAGPMISTFDENITLTDPAEPEKLSVQHGEIRFDNITFTHDENKDSLFKGFSLTIKPGEKIGLVGESGSGKTSLTRLLLRFSDVEAGSISIDGQPITSVTQEELRQNIAYVAQEPLLFHRTLKENIAYGKLNAPLGLIKQAAKRAHALEFIAKLPKGFNTLVGERGVKLSGGQRQRVAIARAILKDAPILVLDEATSALDSNSEALIQEALTELMKDRTSIVIAHRLSTIAKLDRILVLDNGKIIEQGTHSELLVRSGMYAKLWAHQSGGFIEE